MNVMDDKGQPQHPWQYQMYGGYCHPYQQYPSYEPQQFYNYQGAMPYGGINNQPLNHMVQEMHIKQFTHGGQLQAFGQKNETPQMDQEDEREKELPPLPPGPPPAISSLPQPSPPGATNFFPMSNSPGPVRFNMTRPQRPPFNQQTFNQQTFNNSGSSKKKRKKNKNKFNQQQQNQSMNFSPPLPPHQLIRAQAPPLPPGPPPAAPLPPPEEVHIPEPKMKIATHLKELKGAQQDWPVELHNYVTGCYAKCENSLDKDRISIILKGKIMQATNDDTLWIKDWSKEPVPMLLSEMDTVSVQPVFKAKQTQSPVQLKKRESSTLNNRLGIKFRSRSNSRSQSRSRSRSPHKPRQRSPPRPPRRRRERSDSSESENDWIPVQSTKKNKGRNLNHTVSRRGKGKAKGKGRSHFYSEYGMGVGDDEIPVNSELLEKRAARFNCVRRDKATTFTVTNTTMGLYEDTSGDFELEDCHMVGVCQDIEKPYLRLTAAPEASAVRPPDVLVQSLSRVKEKWLKNQDYHYACEQLKSIRQDLTVQGIRDKLTVSVYETHARIALEKGDHAEFNQCQSQLKLLYDELVAENRKEFTAYRILYFIFTKEQMDLNTVMTSLTEADSADECVSHALKVRSAWALNNYHQLFRLYRSAPHMSSYLMDWFLPRERKLALKTIIKAYRQTMPVPFLTQELAFDSDSLTREFLSQFGVVYADEERTKIDCKTSAASVASA